jgi:hypothetical protein
MLKKICCTPTIKSEHTVPYRYVFARITSDDGHFREYVVYRESFTFDDHYPIGQRGNGYYVTIGYAHATEKECFVRAYHVFHEESTRLLSYVKDFPDKLDVYLIDE